MGFLKKHYEKITLVTLLVAFILLLVYLGGIIQATNIITEADLALPIPKADYKPIDFTQKKYALTRLLRAGSMWDKSVARKEGDKVYSDLLVPFECARCPKCKKIIPRFFFFNPPHHCPIPGCDASLPTPVAKESAKEKFIFKPNDWDNDGILNVDEEKVGLDPKNPEDANTDLDKDGFSNLFEYQQNTSVTEAKSHPAMYLRLKLLDLRKTVLDAVLMKVIASGADKRHWDVQINIDNGEKTKFMQLGDMIKLDKHNYSIEDINHNISEVKKGDSILKKDNSSVLLVSDDGKFNITMRVGKRIFSPLPKAIVVDISSGKKYQLDVGDRFRVGDKETGFTRYKVVAVDIKKREVKIRGGRQRKLAVITDKAQMLPVEEASEAANDGNENGQAGQNPPRKESVAEKIFKELNI